MRIQLALNVENLDEAVAFYTDLFGVEAAKRQPGYANFSIDEPPLKLVLFENPGADERLGLRRGGCGDRAADGDGPGRPGRKRGDLLLRHAEQGLVQRSRGPALGVLPRGGR